jgi:hypothetical protein
MSRRRPVSRLGQLVHKSNRLILALIPIAIPYAVTPNLVVCVVAKSD